MKSIPVIFCAVLLMNSLVYLKDVKAAGVATTITVRLKMNEPYQYDLGMFGDEEGALIVRQAKHFRVSRADRQPTSAKIIYSYTPATNFVGKDQVELKSSRSSNDSGMKKRNIYTTIKFTIHN